MEPNGALKFGAYVHEVFRRSQSGCGGWWRTARSEAGSFSGASTAGLWPDRHRADIRTKYFYLIKFNFSPSYTNKFFYVRYHRILILQEQV